MSFFRVCRKMLVLIALFGLFILMAGGLFYCEWGSYGIAEDGAKPDFAGDTYRGGKPVINAMERRIFQNERVAVKELAEAVDEKGESLAEHIHFYDSEGKELSGFLNTSVPGQYEITVLAQSPDTGRSVRKTIRILVDGRVEKGVKGR